MTQRSQLEQCCDFFLISIFIYLPSIVYLPSFWVYCFPRLTREVQQKKNERLMGHVEKGYEGRFFLHMISSEATSRQRSIMGDSRIQKCWFREWAPGLINAFTNAVLTLSPKPADPTVVVSAPKIPNERVLLFKLYTRKRKLEETERWDFHSSPPQVVMKSPDCDGGMEMSLAKKQTFRESRARTEKMSQGREGNRRL